MGYSQIENLLKSFIITKNMRAALDGKDYIRKGLT